MADAAVEFLLNNLKELLLYHSNLITNTKSQIESLEKDLRIFQAFLRDSVKKRREDEHTKAVVQNIRDVVYEVEDVIDLFVTKAREKEANKSSFLKSWKDPYDLHAIGQKVVEVKTKVERAKVDFASIRVDLEDKSEKPQNWPLRERNVVGFEDVIDDLINKLTRETDYYIVSLTGMFGLGKTTVARKIFNDPAIIYEFPVRIWLHISQEFSDKDIFLAILKELTDITDDIRSKDELELRRMVVSRLEKATFLIVMDDVWSCDDWNRLRVALPEDYKQGKILITSRHDDVGKHASCPKPPVRLRFFTHEESWELLRWEALRSLDCPSDLKNHGHIIARDCNGLPLSVVVIGGILAAKYSASDMRATERAWEDVSKKVKEYLNDKDVSANPVNKFISLSYDRLPYHLRACFLYLGVFPEDYEIPVSRLIRLWIGEGFIQQSSESSSLEKTAEKYLSDLITRNLVSIDKFKADGTVKTCRIHDTLREFCRSEAGEKSEKLFQEIKFSNGVFVPPVSEIHKYRRVSVHSNCLDFISSKPVGPHVRSFLCFSKDGFTLPSELISNILEAFELVRVLDVKPIKLTKITRHMYKLVHVRYIALSLMDMASLPKKFGELWNIQTLIIDTTSRKLEVQADIWKLARLRHFKTNASATLPTPGKSKNGAELQTVGHISVESCTTEMFDRACNLKKLGIRGDLALFLEGKMGSFDTLGKMKYLEKLKLVNDVYPKEPSKGQLSCLPQPYQFPKTLESLTLVSTLLSWDLMYILGLLPNLNVLKLRDKAFMGEIWKAVDGGFRCLEFLQIEDTDLSVWEASSHHFPRLGGLVLKKCEKLIRVPIELAEVKSLKRLELYYCKSAAASANKIYEAKMKEKQPEGATFKFSIFPSPNE